MAALLVDRRERQSRLNIVDSLTNDGFLYTCILCRLINKQSHTRGYNGVLNGRRAMFVGNSFEHYKLQMDSILNTTVMLKITSHPI